MNITQFTMEEVRCFAGRQEFEIRPLTFLVGENSTGKTTALACFQKLANYLWDGEIDFNSHPYSMGTFKDIVRKTTKKEKAFKLGFILTGSRKTDTVEHTVEFVEKEGGIEPTVRSLILEFTDGEIMIKADDTKEGDIRFMTCDKEQNKYRIDVHSAFLDRNSPLFLLELPMHRTEQQSEDERAIADYLKKKRGDTMYPWWEMSPGSVFSTSPVRSQPKRTYDPTREFDDPEGSDIPMRLMRTKATDEERWEGLKAKLIDFGKDSGLFQNIEVKNLGRSMGNPFQLTVRVRGPNSNIIDVGYGVSQILPILVHIFDSSIRHRYRSRNLFLLQQPEVHLHPRAQAALSSLLTSVAGRGRGEPSFIVETHSDYMIDRARIEIRKGTIHPENVSLIYLEPKGRVVNVHNISFDKKGHMKGVPPHYRDFFLKETDRLIGFED
ncbi:AAA family ATPase [Candidatus Poribacteria bacterium]|nr:AAA family ATPase [Candidatus Poribacteria bacterium]